MEEGQDKLIALGLGALEIKTKSERQIGGGYCGKGNVKEAGSRVRLQRKY